MRFLLVITVVLSSFFSFAQGMKSLRVKASTGNMLNIHPFFPEEMERSTFLEAEFNLTGNKTWYDHYRPIESGGSFNYCQLGNDEVLGYSLGLNIYIRLQWWQNKRFSLHHSISSGIAYISNPFDKIDNPNNYVFGSRFAWQAQLALHGDFHLTPQLDLSIFGSFVHYSNGHTRVPNIGGNIPLLGIGLNKRFQLEEISVEKDSMSTDLWRIEATFTLGYHELEGTAKPYDGPSYFVYNGGIYLTKKYSPVRRFKFGAQLNYYQAFKAYSFDQGLNYDWTNWDSFKIIAVIGHEYFFGNFGFVFDLGVNLYFPFRMQLIQEGLLEKKFLHTYTSNEIGVNYYPLGNTLSLKHKPFVGLGVKTLGGKADYLSMRMGVIF